jgi:ppGpp synthetase/RelA/SpoT-type nucleotidyltranferase
MSSKIEMSDIGDYIDDHKASLEAWGSSIRDHVEKRYRHLLKVPAAVRVKDPQSARAKQLRKNYSDPVSQMTDLVGTRFVVLTSEDLSPIRVFIEGNPEWQVTQARDPDEEIEIHPEAFGYQSHHYEVRPKTSLELAGCTVTPACCCEVQVRTILQHAYAEFTHDSLYKASQEVPSQAMRLVSRSMALMEVTDALLCQAMQAVRIANAPALALQSKARDLVEAMGIRTPQAVLDQISEAFRTVIDPRSSPGLQRFVDQNRWVLANIQDRLGRGLFAFPDAALITYWLTTVAEDELLRDWPLPGSRADVELVLSDMGFGT